MGEWGLRYLWIKEKFQKLTINSYIRGTCFSHYINIELKVNLLKTCLLFSTITKRTILVLLDGHQTAWAPMSLFPLTRFELLSSIVGPLIYWTRHFANMASSDRVNGTTVPSKCVSESRRNYSFSESIGRLSR